MTRIKVKSLLAAAALAPLVPAGSAWAQTPTESPDATAPDAKANPLLSMFNLKPAPTPDPARLVVAQRIAGKLVPDGTLQMVADKLFASFLKPLMSMGGDYPANKIAAFSGLSGDDVRALPKETKDAVMAIYDPAWKEREQAKTEATQAMMSKMMGLMEPVIREVFARSLARRFTVEQLGDVEAFFSTPTGTAYAQYQIQMITDPYLFSDLMTEVPKLKDQMMGAMAVFASAEASVPPPRQIADLGENERRHLADLLGVKPEDLADPQDAVVEVAAPEDSDQ